MSRSGSCSMIQQYTNEAIRSLTCPDQSSNLFLSLEVKIRSSLNVGYVPRSKSFISSMIFRLKIIYARSGELPQSRAPGTA